MTDHHFAKCDQQAKPIGVFGKPSIADFATAKHLLDVSKQKLHFRADPGFDLLGIDFVGTQSFPCTGVRGDELGYVSGVLGLSRF